MYVALRDLRAARGRFALVGLVIALVAFMTTLLTGLAAGLVDDGISGLRQLPLTQLAMEPSSGGTFSRSVLTEENLAPWRAVDGVEASPIGVSFANAKDPRGKTVSIALLGVDEGSFLATRPEARDALAGPPGLVLSHELKEEGIEVGDELVVAGSDIRLPVLGFTYAGSYGHVDIAFTQLTTWQQVFYGDSARGRFSAVALRNEGGEEVPAATVARVDRAAGTETLTKTEAYAGSPGYSGETQTMSLIRGFLLVISALVVGAFFTVWTVQRTRQIALLKAIGASTSYVVRDALGQMAVVLVAATATGAALAWLLGLAISGTDVPFRLELMPVLGAVSLLFTLGLAGCLAAVRRITRVDPAGALRQVD
ncbi:ABC transporter permease [Nocardioides marmoriginsengisoli]|uniref:ABC transporter permease n=1 Tax=Nocardioides marmoriginsengisoli TaxID=661483 RepID=A0A3N0CAZ6_9ACTN|nr:ABC transporter permease [Nocardioides marmoriginsengisoli]RNL60401.1 ABC transporter permease [Nocardioides marmoriginsengisoli]